MPEAANSASSQLILTQIFDEYAILTINREEKRNAMSAEARARFREALNDLYEMKAIVVTGVGKAFCAGVDLVEKVAPPVGRVGSQVHASWLACQDAIRMHPAIFIAAVNGFALGGGSTLVNNCELAVAGQSAIIGTPEIGFDVWPGLAGPALIKRVAPKHAAELIFNAKRVDADTAFRMGLVNEVVPDDMLLQRAHEMAANIAQFDPIVLDYGKKAYHRMLAMDWDDAMDYSIYTNDAIKNRRPGPNLRREAFAQGQRGPGQGA